MADAEKNTNADADWTEEARREKERLSQEEAQPERLPEPTFSELVNLIVIQALAGLGMMPGPQGERIGPNFEVAKHFIDMLAVLDDKTKNNLTPEEKQLLEQVTYDLRMRYVESTKAGTVPPAPGPTSDQPPARD